jgi:uncharacterized cofD-like protein
MLKWLRPGLYLKRWALLLGVGITSISVGASLVLIEIYRSRDWSPFIETITLSTLNPVLRGAIFIVAGIGLVWVALWRLNFNLTEPYGLPRSIRELLRSAQEHQQLRQGIRVVAMGGGTGLPSALRAMKTQTSNITAVVTMADDGGSSGRLRREYGMQPPGDLRSNITALAHDEALMTQLFDYRFPKGELSGHSFGNLFLAALANMRGGMDHAAAAAGRILAIQGRVLPCTTDDVNLVAEVQHLQSGKQMRIEGESNIPSPEWKIEKVALQPQDAIAYREVFRAIWEADLVIIGPGSLYTSIIPNLLVKGVVEALRQSPALKVYVCNIATQPGETDGYTVSDHVDAIERHAGHGVTDVVLANNHYPIRNAGPNTIYVQRAPNDHPIYSGYQVVYTDLTEEEFPWRHSPEKLQQALLQLYTIYSAERSTQKSSLKFSTVG